MLTDATKDIGLTAIAGAINKVKLHSDEPNAAGVGSELTDAEAAIAYGAASGGSVDIDQNYDVPVSAGDDVQWYSLWEGNTFRGKKAFGTGDTYSNDGFARLTSLAITLSDLV